MTRLAIIFLMLLPTTLVAQDSQSEALELPECDIFLFDVQESDDDLAISNPRNVTARPGYDNQPWFTPDSGSFLFTANRKPDRTDVFEYFIESGETKQVTDTADQEYSPQSSPDNGSVSYVTDGATANQSVWFTKRDSGQQQWLLANQGEREPIGYYSWNRDSGYILYWSRYGHSMRLVHESKELSHYVTGNAPPSTPHIIPAKFYGGDESDHSQAAKLSPNRFSFLHRQANGETWLKELDPQSLAIRPLTTIKGNNNNYCWTPMGHVLMADGSELYRWNAKSKDGWQLVVDLDDHGLQTVTRVACSSDGKKLAIVALPKE